MASEHNTTMFLPVPMLRIPTDSAPDFWQLGSEFQKAARLVFEKEKFMPNFPGYALVGQAIELYLKAYLRAKGRSVSDLKSIGHNLELALKRAEEQNLAKHFNVGASDRELLVKLSRVFRSKDFHYKIQGGWELPLPCWTLDFADRLSRIFKPT